MLVCLRSGTSILYQFLVAQTFIKGAWHTAKYTAVTAYTAKPASRLALVSLHLWCALPTQWVGIGNTLMIWLLASLQRALIGEATLI